MLATRALRAVLSLGYRAATTFTAQLRARVLLYCRLLSAVNRLPPAEVQTAVALPADQLLSEVRRQPLRKEKSATGQRHQSVLAIDIGGTRTKFLLVDGTTIRRLPPAPTAVIWQNASLDGNDKFEPAGAPRRMQAYLQAHGISMKQIGRLAFSVPGTVDITEGRVAQQADEAHTGTGSEGHTGSDGLDDSQMTIVKNTPSMSPRFRGFDFKDSFHDVAPAAKVSAIADNLAAALGPGPPTHPNPKPNPNRNRNRNRNWSPNPTPNLSPNPTPNPNPHPSPARRTRGRVPAAAAALCACPRAGHGARRGDALPRPVGQGQVHRDGHLAVVGLVHQDEARRPVRLRGRPQGGLRRMPRQADQRRQDTAPPGQPEPSP